MQALLPAPGASVWIRQHKWIVERARVDRSVLRLDVASGARRLTFLVPFDRPVVPHPRLRPTRVRRQQALARLARALGASHSFDLPHAALCAPIDILAYQLEPTLALLSGIRRVLVADDVGLGKTIQAGLALAELQHRRASCRALVVVPAPLVDQWVRELRDRLSLEATAVDQDALDRHALELAVGTTPWDRPGIWIASPDYLKQRHVLGGIPLTPWDMVIIDEAHGVAGDSDRHEACHELAQRARRVMLLTATPHSGDDDRFRRLLGIGQLPRENDGIQMFRRSRAEFAGRPMPVARWPHVALEPAARQVLDALVAFERAVLRSASAVQRPGAQLLTSVLRKRAASTLHALDQSLGRRLEWLQAPDRAYRLEWLQPPLPFVEEEAHDDEERLALTAASGLPAAHERAWLRRLQLLCAAALPRDPKVHHLTSLLMRRAETAVVFTEYRASLDCLQKRLSDMRAVAALHGGLTVRERRDQLQMFLEGHASVLLATDVGGQGLNLQSRGRWVINVDVPWNPARLVQRVGRVDRIGQSRRVHATTLCLPHAVEDHVVESMARREARVRHVMGATPINLGGARMTERRSDPAASAAPPAALTVCTTFRRRARAMARALTARRAWLGRWRGPFLVESRPCRTSGAFPGESGRIGGLLAILTFPILDGSGTIVEQHIRAVRIDYASRWTSEAGTWLPLAGQALSRSIGARVARVRRVEEARAAAEMSIESAVGDVVHALNAPEETQLTFFSRREHADFDRAREVTDVGDADRAGRVADLRAARTIDAGHPALLAVFEKRP
ncbi:MAG: helicase-related protein [Acidobacteriota bacterium]